jgi:stringent starvation protein B
MTSQKPYLLRALYEWIGDNNMTVYIVANVDVPNIKVPMKFAQDGQITLNISSLAALKLQMSNDYIQFNARFGGVPMQVVIPIRAVVAIYAKETGEGMFFQVEDADDDAATEFPQLESEESDHTVETININHHNHPHKPNLKIIK